MEGSFKIITVYIQVICIYIYIYTVYVYNAADSEPKSATSSLSPGFQVGSGFET